MILSNILIDQAIYQRHKDALRDYLLKEYETQCHPIHLSAGTEIQEQLEKIHTHPCDKVVIDTHEKGMWLSTKKWLAGQDAMKNTKINNSELKEKNWLDILITKKYG